MVRGSFWLVVCHGQDGGLKVKFNVSALKGSSWHEYVIRFVFGGSVTALVGAIAKRYGPEAGGLFLAFPAIFPAAATLIQKHEQKKEDGRGNESGGKRAIIAAGLDAVGSAFGAIGLVAFATIVWGRLPHGSTLAIVLAIATVAWVATSMLAWAIWQKQRKKARAKRSHHSEPKLDSYIRDRPRTGG
jgi:Protein of unknown function (DUF3147)